MTDGIERDGRVSDGSPGPGSGAVSQGDTLQGCSVVKPLGAPETRTALTPRAALVAGTGGAVALGAPCRAGCLHLPPGRPESGGRRRRLDPHRPAPLPRCAGELALPPYKRGPARPTRPSVRSFPEAPFQPSKDAGAPAPVSPWPSRFCEAEAEPTPGSGPARGESGHRGHRCCSWATRKPRPVGKGPKASPVEIRKMGTRSTCRCPHYLLTLNDTLVLESVPGTEKWLPYMRFTTRSDSGSQGTWHNSCRHGFIRAGFPVNSLQPGHIPKPHTPRFPVRLGAESEKCRTLTAN